MGCTWDPVFREYCGLLWRAGKHRGVVHGFALNSHTSAIADSGEYPPYARGGRIGFAELARTLRGLGAELEWTPQRGRRAARIALITALGAGVTAFLQISNALGLTLLFNFAAPEMALSFTAAIRFLLGAAVCQALGLALAGAMADSPIPHLAIFIALSIVSGYLIYANPRIGRLWVWVQVPVLTAFYLVIFDPDGFGWTDEQAFVGVAAAVAILYAANTLLWPKSAAQVLGESLAITADRSRRRLTLLLHIWAGVDGLGPKDDRPVASKLGYHLTLLGPASRHSQGVEVVGRLLAAVMVAERVHNEIERIAELVCECAGTLLDEGVRDGLMRAGTHLDAMLERYVSELVDVAGDSGREPEGGRGPAPFRSEDRRSAPARSELAGLRAYCRDSETQGRAAGVALGLTIALIERLETICTLLEIHPAELSSSFLGTDQDEDSNAWGPTGRAGAEADRGDATASARPSRPRRNRFLVRYAVRHTIAMALAFVSGLFVNNAAMHAALWLLMIGGPPSHGATVRKFTIRAIGAAAALSLAALGTILLAPNGTTVVAYMFATFMGSLVMAYIGQGGGLISYLSIGGTAFVIAFSGPGPRNDAFASIWTIWGISFGMLIMAAVAIVWREWARRTLVEEFQAPLEALVALVSAAHRRDRSAAEVDNAQMALINGVSEMLSVASDAQLEGRGAGIDAANLVDALDSLRRVGFMLGNLALLSNPALLGNLASEDFGNADLGDAAAQAERESLEAALHARLADWLESLRLQDAEGVPSLAPLRGMVLTSAAPDLSRWAALGGDHGRLAELVRTLEEQLKTVSVH